MVRPAPSAPAPLASWGAWDNKASGAQELRFFMWRAELAVCLCWGLGWLPFKAIWEPPGVALGQPKVHAAPIAAPVLASD